MPQVDYGSDKIKTLTMCEQMRLRPQMWGFQTSSIEGNLIQIKEVVDNAADEALDPNRVYPIDVTFFVSRDKSMYQCLVRDNGRGIPVDKLEACFTKEFTSGKYEGQYGGASTGTNGVGSKAAAAFSTKFIAFTNRQSGFGYLKLEKGMVKESKTSKRPASSDPNTFGTIVFFQPDPEMFSCIPQMFGDPEKGDDKNGFEKHTERMEFYGLFKRNIVLTVMVVDRLLRPTDLNKEPQDLWKDMLHPENYGAKVAFRTDPNVTPRSYVIEKFHLKDPIWELGEIHKISTGSDDPLGFDIDVFVDEKSCKGDNGYIGAVNATPIVHPESSHIAVLQDVIKQQMQDLIDNEGAKTFFEEKYRIPLSGCISAYWQGASFIGQDKKRFEDRSFNSQYGQALRKICKKITEEKGEGFWDNLFELIKENFELEYAKFSRTAYKSSKSMKGIGYELNRKGSYEGCESEDNRIIELFITEGDSAAGRVQTKRNPVTQALLKLSGKPINAIRNEGDKLNKNAIFQDMVTLLGVTPADKNLDNMKFSKILIMTDADADGYHIVVLLFSILYKINPLILEQGRVCVTCPPLYAILNKQTNIYLRDEAALRDARYSAYNTLFRIESRVTVNGKAGAWIETNKDKKLFRDICMIAEYLKDVVYPQATLLNINPMVLEQLLHVYQWLDEDNVNTEAIRKKLRLDNVVWDQLNHVVVLVDHEVEFHLPLVNLKKTIVSKLLPAYDQFNWQNVDLRITTKESDMYANDPCTFIMLATLFEDVNSVFKVSRFKGLGEMDEDSIDLTCINKETRCFKTIRGMGDIDEFFRYLDVDSEGRKKLVEKGFMET